MWKVNPPTFSVTAVLSACVSNISNATKKANYEGIADDLVAAELAFRAAVLTATLHELDPVQDIGQVDTDDMIWLYEQKLVSAKAPGRRFYDRLKMAPPNGKCPLCGRGNVYSLDHHLPKTRFADLAITPVNLLPSCQDCNKTKTQAVPGLAAEETLHPYFDDVESAVWLMARVIEVSPAALFFYPAPPNVWSTTLQRRVKHHFRVFKLRKAYASDGAQLIGNIRGHLVRSVSKQGPAGIQSYLRDQAESFREVRTNSWEAAAYTALSENDWFCNGGYAQLG